MPHRGGRQVIDTIRLNEEMRAIFGHDVNVTLARTPRWGAADTCLLVNGKRHKAVSQEIARRLEALGARTELESNESPAHTTPVFSYSILTATSPADESKKASTKAPSNNP